MQDDKESYLLLLLSDANLPTGSFVASAGLESTAAHALFRVPGPPGSDILAFLRSSVDTYARSALPFARDAHRVAAAYVSGEPPEPDLDAALVALTKLDALYDASTLNHVARRASCAQGAALLTLYTRGFTRPALLPSLVADDDENRAAALVAALKLRVRRGEPDAPVGHLPVCWGVLTGALGLTVGEHPGPVARCADTHTHTHTYMFVYRAWRALASVSPCARRAVRCGTNEHRGPVCCAAASAACGAARGRRRAGIHFASCFWGVAGPARPGVCGRTAPSDDVAVRRDPCRST